MGRNFPAFSIPDVGKSIARGYLRVIFKCKGIDAGINRFITAGSDGAGVNFTARPFFQKVFEIINPFLIGESDLIGDGGQ